MASYLRSGRPALRIPSFWVVATLSGFLGLAISFTSMWFLHQTSPTTYRLVTSCGFADQVASCISHHRVLELTLILSYFWVQSGRFFEQDTTLRCGHPALPSTDNFCQSSQHFFWYGLPHGQQELVGHPSLSVRPSANEACVILKDFSRGCCLPERSSKPDFGMRCTRIVVR